MQSKTIRLLLVTSGLTVLASLATAIRGQEATPTAKQPSPAYLKIPADNDGLPGKGTIRRYDWFQDLWQQKRTQWHQDTPRDQGAVVFFGDSITQGWGPDMGGSFAGTKVANRGISGDTTRGMLLRIEDDVLAVNPTGVVMLMGTNDLEEQDSAEDTASNVQAIVSRLVAHNPAMPIFLCKVFPSSARMRRPTKDIQRINELCCQAVANIKQVIVLDTWSIFADDNGDARPEALPDLLHPNELGYAKWAETLRPAFAKALPAKQANANAVVWQGESGPGKGKHIVFLAGDHEYRGEETLPALARILAKRFGFKCTFLVTTNPETGAIDPGSSHITGLEALATADLMVVFLRFQHFADDQMQHIEDYLNAGKPVIGLRTATHAFQGLKGKFEKYNEGYQGEDEAWRFGFGEHILGEHWVGHFGRNHQQSSNLILAPEQLQHAILRGVTKPHAMCGGYVGHPTDGITLARGQVLDGMSSDSPPSKKPEQQMQHAVAWVRHYQPNKARSRVFATTHGASEDILNDDFRRLLINAHLWCLGMEEHIDAKSPIDFVGPYHPATFNFGGYRRSVKPSDIAGWDTPIYAEDKPTK